MKAQLRRSYEFEVAGEWEAETVTLGEAELLKSIAWLSCRPLYTTSSTG